MIWRLRGSISMFLFHVRKCLNHTLYMRREIRVETLIISYTIQISITSDLVHIRGRTLVSFIYRHCQGRRVSPWITGCREEIACPRHHGMYCNRFTTCPPAYMTNTSTDNYETWWKREGEKAPAVAEGITRIKITSGNICLSSTSSAQILPN